MDIATLNNLDLVELENYIKENNIFDTTIARFIGEYNDLSSLENVKDEYILFAKANYLYQITVNGSEEMTSDVFFWDKNFIKLWVIGVNDRRVGKKSILNFATKSNDDEIEIIDAVQITTSSKFYQLDRNQQIGFLIENKIIPNISDEIIISSISENPFIDSWIESWVYKEFRNINRLTSAPAELFEFNKSIIRAKRYNFEEMLTVINNDQFTMEFDECLYAYNNEKWFICAAGLGGILEHLIYLTLEKNNLIDNNFPDDPTAKIYIEHLSRSPIKIKKREKTHLRSLFLIRNSVSHFNQGFTSKEQCQTLMNGIRDFFNNYYTKDFNLEDN